MTESRAKPTCKIATPSTGLTAIDLHLLIAEIISIQALHIDNGITKIARSGIDIKNKLLNTEKTGPDFM